MNPGDAHRLKIEEGEVAQVSTPQGRSLQLKVKYSSKVISGVVTSPYPCSLIDEEGTVPVNVNRLKSN
jgi:anaerobic selenocysteine-containing dehydrogenase